MWWTSFPLLWWWHGKLSLVGMEEGDGKEERRITYWMEAMRCVLNSQLSPYFSCKLLFPLLFLVREASKSNESMWVKAPSPANWRLDHGNIQALLSFQQDLESNTLLNAEALRGACSNLHRINHMLIYLGIGPEESSTSPNDVSDSSVSSESSWLWGCVVTLPSLCQDKCSSPLYLYSLKCLPSHLR